MEGKEYIEKSKLNINLKEKFIQKIINLSKKAGIKIPENMIRVIAAQEWDSRVKPSEIIKKNKDIQRKIKSIIKKEIGLEEEEIYKKINNLDWKKKGITETWRLFQLYIHLEDEKMLDDMINNLYS